MICFHDDKITPVKCAFKQEATLIDAGIRCFFAIGPKHVLLSKNDEFTQIFDIFMIKQKLPLMEFKDGVAIFEGQSGDPRRLIFKNQMGSSVSIKIISDFQKTNFTLQMELNTHPTIQIPEGLEEYINNYYERCKEAENPNYDDDEGTEEMSDFSNADSDSDY